ncbi:MAG: hypothetical protein ACI4TG_04915 [Ruminococcus sp.]
MSTKEAAMEIINYMTEEQLQEFVRFFHTMMDIPNAETSQVLEEVRAGKNLSKPFSSVEALMEDLHADD